MKSDSSFDVYARWRRSLEGDAVRLTKENAELRAKLQVMNTSGMAFDDELGWLHKDSLVIVNELRAKLTRAEVRLAHTQNANEALTDRAEQAEAFNPGEDQVDVDLHDIHLAALEARAEQAEAKFSTEQELRLVTEDDLRCLKVFLEGGQPAEYRLHIKCIADKHAMKVKRLREVLELRARKLGTITKNHPYDHAITQCSCVACSELADLRRALAETESK